ncbi:allantoate deiminase [Isobaculum melis]|uniref:Allantoate deiminase n=1 Tax=Isobaculum melis TaxID=142588 RepID=A0A1H9PW60_9LACT|nr:allantoate deiminase [Isobaculum melis]SER52009.1 allantoate deiminase [Isobaculum melis]
MFSLTEKEVQAQIEAFAQFGATPDGGITRLLYTEEWLAAQQFLQQRLASIGMSTRFDEVGNLFGRIEGTKYPAETILSGSHMDTVVNGGKLDGQFGIIAAYLAMEQLIKTYGPPLRSLEVISMAEEEGSRFPFNFFGSKNLFGAVKQQEIADLTDIQGVTFEEAMTTAGFQLKASAQPARSDIQAFLELHIEQGKILETEEKTIGIVTSIVGQKCYTIVLKGEANHAGTTPMSYRKDALVAFSTICVEATAKAKLLGDPLVLTFGQVIPKPNVTNVVAGEVHFTMDCRHTDEATLNRFTTEIEKDMKKTAQAMGLMIDIQLRTDEAPVQMDAACVALLQKSAEKLQLPSRLMHSGAGHDAEIIAKFVPTAMLFVPSIGGISHNPAEATALKDLMAGIETLATALYELAYIE